MSVNPAEIVLPNISVRHRWFMSECHKKEQKHRMPKLSNQIINAAIYGFEEQRRRLDAQIAELRGMLVESSNGATPSARPKARKKRRMSAAGRKAIAEAQRKRWAAS